MHAGKDYALIYYHYISRMKVIIKALYIRHPLHPLHGKSFYGQVLLYRES